MVVRRVAHLNDAPAGAHPDALVGARPGASAASPSFVVIGCGNLNRSDDAVGVRVIQQLRLEFGADVPAGVKPNVTSPGLFSSASV